MWTFDHGGHVVTACTNCPCVQPRAHRNCTCSSYELLQRFSGRLKLNVKLLVEVQSTMTTNYTDAAVYLCYIGSCHG